MFFSSKSYNIPWPRSLHLGRRWTCDRSFSILFWRIHILYTRLRGKAYKFLVADTRLYTLVCRSVHPSVGPSVRRSITFLNYEWLSHYCSCPTVFDWIAVYPALFYSGEWVFISLTNFIDKWGVASAKRYAVRTAPRVRSYPSGPRPRAGRTSFFPEILACARQKIMNQIVFRNACRKRRNM